MKKQKSRKKYSFRKLLNDLHLWLGLGSGIILFLVCLSGTILTFQTEIKSLFEQKLEVDPKQGNILSVEALQEKLSQEGTVTGVTLTDEPTKAYEFKVKTSPEDRRGTTFYVNQYTGEYQQNGENPLDEFFFSMFKLHRWLLVDSAIGRPIVGIATIIFVFLSISGIVLWFPKKKIKWKTLKPGFKIKWSANWKRINHDLHNTLGFYSCILLLVMALTGLFWSFEWYRDLGSEVLGTQVFGGRGGPKIASEASENTKTKNIAEVISISEGALNYPGKTSISFPQDETGIFSIRKYEKGNWSPNTADLLIIDRDGKILKKELFADKPLNVQIASLIKPIHTGEIFGSFSKILYFLACLIATSLPITGTLIWVNKMKKKKKKAPKPVKQAEYA